MCRSGYRSFSSRIAAPRLERFRSPRKSILSRPQLKAFVDLCHIYGLGVILDVVYNHAGPGFDDQSMRFFDHPHDHQEWDGDNYFFDHRVWTGPIFRFDKEEVQGFLIDNAK